MKWVALASIAAVVVVAATVGVLELRGADAPAASYRGSTPPSRIFLPTFELRDYSGKVISRQAVEGRVVVVTFLETQCTEACPIIADQIGRALDRLTEEQREQVIALAISTHPKDDTPVSVRAFLRRHRVEGDLHYLIGSERKLRPAWQAFHIFPAFDSGDADMHSAPVRIFSPDGRWVSTLHPGIDLTPANLAHDVVVALGKSET